MIVCQNCKSNEPDGAIFCSNCGSELVQLNATLTQKIAPNAEDLQNENPEAYPTVNPIGAWVSLHLLDSGRILALSDRSEYTLGRISQDQPIEPDVDLSPYKAYDNGVSRMHAVLKHVEGAVILLDLGSSNGTYINGGRILPKVEHHLRHGDIVSLGKLKMQIVIS